MLKRQNTRFIIALIVLISLIAMNINLSTRLHYHIDTSGRIVTHAHPDTDPQKSSDGAGHHQHTNLDFLQYSILIRILSGIFFLLVLLFLISGFDHSEKLPDLFEKTTLFQYIKCITRRGPPFSPVL